MGIRDLFNRLLGGSARRNDPPATRSPAAPMTGATDTGAIPYPLVTVHGSAALALAREQYLYCNDIVDQGAETLQALAAGLMVDD